jgi:hypothetical protein
MLETQRGSEYQNGNYRNLANAPLTFDSGIQTASLLPESSDVSSCSSGVAADEISWSNGSGDVGAFGEMLSLVAGGKDAAVATRSWSTPGSYFAFICSDCERPSGVDELYCTPADVVLSEDIDNLYALFAHLNPGKPKEQHGARRYQSHSGQGHKCDSESFANQNHEPGKGHYDHARKSYGPAGSGSEYLHAKSLACHGEVLS